MPLRECVPQGMRPEIAFGWRRCVLSGLDPGMEVKELPLVDVDRRSRLLQAATPVLTKLSDDLGDTRFSVLLADRSARIVSRTVVDGGTSSYLDRVRAVPGAPCAEELSGTNSLATAYEVRRPVSVIGEEHFLEALRGLCCYGAPIIHPITRRLQGVLDVTGPVADQNALLGPIVLRAIADIEQRLQAGSRLSEQRLFAEFQAASAHTRRALLAVGENLVLSNAAAVDLIGNDDHATLYALTRDLGPTGATSANLVLSSGETIGVNARSVTGGGALVELISRRPVRGSADRGRGVTGPPGGGAVARRRIVLISGAPGTGRSRRALAVAGGDAVVFDLATGRDSGDLRQSQLREALQGLSNVVLDNIHLADSATAESLRSTLGDAIGLVVMVGPPVEELTESHHALVASADTAEELPLLRDAGHRFPQLVHDVLGELAGERDIPWVRPRVTPSAMAVLADQDWPGNLAELRRVLRAAARDDRAEIDVEDLPATHRQRPVRRLTPLERAERATILAALSATNGNKAATAAKLEIGRTTLYQRLRYYQI